MFVSKLARLFRYEIKVAKEPIKSALVPWEARHCIDRSVLYSKYLILLKRTINKWLRWVAIMRMGFPGTECRISEKLGTRSQFRSKQVNPHSTMNSVHSTSFDTDIDQIWQTIIIANSLNVFYGICLTCKSK